MSHTGSPASVDAPYLSNTAEKIEQLLSSGGAPMDTACGLLATDPALLLHLLRRVAESAPKEKLNNFLSLRQLASRWLEAADHRWYSSVLPVCHSALSAKQREEHRKLCTRSAVAAGLIGEWSLHEVESLQKGADIAELHCVVAVLPSMLQLCRIEHGVVYESLDDERTAWFDELGNAFGRPLAETFEPSDEQMNPAKIAIEIAAAAVQHDADEILELNMPEWSRRLSRTVPELYADLDHIGDGLALLGKGKTALRPERALKLINSSSGPSDEELNCENCRQNNYENALSTVRNRIAQSDATLSEVISHIMHAICNCGSLRRASWYFLDESHQLLQNRRRKTAINANELSNDDLKIEEMPLMQLLIERPRLLHVYPEMRQKIQEILPQQNSELFAENYLCASIFCGSTPVGVLYADADEKTIGAVETARFKAVVSLASKTLTLLAMRNKSTVDESKTSELPYPTYASFAATQAANESEDSTEEVKVSRL